VLREVFPDEVPDRGVVVDNEDVGFHRKAF
jgi:hypothetical protein